MNRVQFHSIAAPLWLIASQLEKGPLIALAFAAMFAFHSCASAYLTIRGSRS